jgi:hypothetical protein
MPGARGEGARGEQAGRGAKKGGTMIETYRTASTDWQGATQAAQSPLQGPLTQKATCGVANASEGNKKSRSTAAQRTRPPCVLGFIRRPGVGVRSCTCAVPRLHKDAMCG